MAIPSINIGDIVPKTTKQTERISLMVFVDDDSALSKEMVIFAKSVANSNSFVDVDIKDAAGGTNEMLRSLKLEYWPCMVLKKGEFTRIRYYGAPTGFEQNPFMEAVDELFKSSPKLSQKSKNVLQTVRRKANIKLFVLTTCTFCPVVARHAYRAAIESPRITTEVIDSAIFVEWSQKHLVAGVPKVVLNDNTDITGAVSEEEFMEKLREADHALIDNIYG